jgi:hypothetical protein
VGDEKQPNKPGPTPATFMIALPFEEAVKAAVEVKSKPVAKKSKKPKKRRS